MSLVSSDYPKPWRSEPGGVALAIRDRRFTIGRLYGPLPGIKMPDHPLDPLARLMQTLRQRAETRPAGSYTTKLLDGGPEKIGAKIREEAEELIESASESGDAGRDHFIYEAGDLIYHTLVMLAYRGVDLNEVAAELARREGTSGLAEKAARRHTSETNSNANTSQRPGRD